MSSNFLNKAFSNTANSKPEYPCTIKLWISKRYFSFLFPNFLSSQTKQFNTTLSEYFFLSLWTKIFITKHFQVEQIQNQSRYTITLWISKRYFLFSFPEFSQQPNKAITNYQKFKCINETLTLFTSKGKAQRPEGRRIEISRGTERFEASFEDEHCQK